MAIVYLFTLLLHSYKKSNTVDKAKKIKFHSSYRCFRLGRFLRGETKVFIQLKSPPTSTSRQRGLTTLQLQLGEPLSLHFSSHQGRRACYCELLINIVSISFVVLPLCKGWNRIKMAACEELRLRTASVPLTEADHRPFMHYGCRCVAHGCKFSDVNNSETHLKGI